MDETEELDASLGGQWRLEKWLPRNDSEIPIENDHRWEPIRTPILRKYEIVDKERKEWNECDSDIQGFYYEWNGSYYRIIISRHFVCVTGGLHLGSYAALVGVVAALLISF